MLSTMLMRDALRKPIKERESANNARESEDREREFSRYNVSAG
jgi:hypothetical protein